MTRQGGESVASPLSSTALKADGFISIMPIKLLHDTKFKKIAEVRTRTVALSILDRGS